MESVLDRLRQELDTLGDRVSSAIEQGRLHVEKVRLASLRKDVAAELGLLAHAVARGAPGDDTRHQALLERLDDLQAQLERVERELSSERGRDVLVTEAPPTAGPMDPPQSGPA